MFLKHLLKLLELLPVFGSGALAVLLLAFAEVGLKTVFLLNIKVVVHAIVKQLIVVYFVLTVDLPHAFVVEAEARFGLDQLADLAGKRIILFNFFQI